MMMDKTADTGNGGGADSPISVLEEESNKQKLSVGSEVPLMGEDNDMVFNSNNMEMPLITDDMAEEEKRLEEARAKQEDIAAEILLKTGTPKIDDSGIGKLEELLNQTQLYTEFLLEKMDNINFVNKNANVNGNSQSAAGRKRGRPPSVTHNEDSSVNGKAKAASGRKRGRGQQATRNVTRVAVEAMLANCKEERSIEGSDNLTEEERNWKEQMELVPLFTGGRLKSYQIKGVKWMISLWQNGLNGILADQMGLGKTVQTIAFLAHLKGMGMHGPFLIVAPLSTLSNWVNEFQRFVPSMNVILYHGSKVDRAELRRKHMPTTVGPTFPVIVTSYEVSMNDRRCFACYKWKYLVVDEGHRLKNFDCKLLRELKQVPVDNTLLLTGTPLQNNLAELWSLLNFILPQVFTSLREFQSWFDLSGRPMNGMQQDEIDEKKRVQVISKLHAILRPFLLRRLKEDVEKKLPLKKEVILYAKMTEHQKRIQEHLINKTLIPYLHEIAENGRPVKKNLENLMIQLRKNFNHPDLLQSQLEISFYYPPVHQLMEQCGKFQLLDRLIKHLTPRGHKILIFSQWTKVLDLMEYCLSEQGYEVCRIDGSVKLVDRQRQIKDFNDPGSNIHIFLLSTRAGGLGINLTAADTCIIYDSDWNPQMDLQAMDRCHRIGQTRPVHVYRLATAHSIECRMLNVAFGKLKLEHVVIERGQFCQERNKPSALKESDLLALLKQDKNDEEDFVQSDEISEENLLWLLDRSDMIQNSGDSESDVKSSTFPLKGPGWEVVVRTGQAGSMLSSIEGYKGCDDKALQQ